MADKRLDQTTNAAAVAATDNIPFVTAAGVTSYVTGDEFATSSILTSRYKPLASDTIWIPAQAHNLGGGSPALSSTFANYTVWALDSASLEWVRGSALIPPGWNTLHFDIWWTNLGAGSGNVQLVSAGQAVGDGDSSAIWGTIGTAYPGAAYAAPAQDVVEVTRTTSTAHTAAAGKVLFWYVARVATEAADTLNNDIGFFGVLLTRVS